MENVNFNDEKKTFKETSKSFFKDFFSVKMITLNAFVAALYAVLTIICYPLSYSFIQLRISEMLNLLVFFNPSYTLGLTIGCLLANLMSSSGIFDITLGTLATLLSCLLMIGFSKLTKNLFFSGLIPCVLNALMVPFIIYLASLGTIEEFILEAPIFFIMAGWTFLGEFIAINVIGYFIFMLLSKKYKGFSSLFNASYNLDFKW